MKTLLIPALALTLASLPALAQKAAEPAAPTPPPVVTPPAAPATSPGLLRKVQFEDAALSEVISYLNVKLAEQKVDPLNIVLSAGLETTKVPTVVLQNVTAADVLNVVAKMIDLTVEPVPSDSGKVAAWIISKRAVRSVPGATSKIQSYNSSRPNAAASTDRPQEWRHSYDKQLVPNNPAPTNPVDELLDSTAQWDALVSPPAPAQVSRVIGIGKIYDQFAGKDDEGRARKEVELVKMLSTMTDEQHLACNVRLYHELHVIVVKGVPEAVALVEQTISALKENAGVKNPAAVGAPRNF